MSPVAPCARRSNPGSPASGPTSPAPEIEQTTRRGFSARGGSTPRPRLSSAPGRKFSTRTSAFAAVVFEIPYEFLLLGVNRDDRLIRRHKRSGLIADRSEERRVGVEGKRRWS